MINSVTLHEQTALEFVLKCGYISAPAGVCCTGFVPVAVETLCAHSPPINREAEDRAEGKGLAAKTAGIHEALHGPFRSRLHFCGGFFIR